MSHAALGQATTTKKMFSRETAVAIHIATDPPNVWAILTNAPDYPQWNSTILSLEGNLAAGGKIKLRSTLSPERTFSLQIKAWEPAQRLVWGDAMGQRTFTLTPQEEGTLFTMVEKIGGPLFPLFAGMIPSFDASFEQFAADLKKAAEATGG